MHIFRDLFLSIANPQLGQMTSSLSSNFPSIISYIKTGIGYWNSIFWICSVSIFYHQENRCGIGAGHRHQNCWRAWRFGAGNQPGRPRRLFPDLFPRDYESHVERQGNGGDDFSFILLLFDFDSRSFVDSRLIFWFCPRMSVHIRGAKRIEGFLFWFCFD